MNDLHAVTAWLLAASAVDLLVMAVLLMRLTPPSLFLAMVLLSASALLAGDVVGAVLHALWHVGVRP